MCPRRVVEAGRLCVSLLRGAARVIRDVEHVLAYQDPKHACNQGSIVRLANGELLLGYNEERGVAHADSGQSCVIRSADGGRTWDAASRVVVWPYDEHTGNWDCAFAQISDGTILMHTRVCAFMSPTALKDGADQVLGGPPPGRAERLKRQTGYSIARSTDGGRTWSTPRPVNTSPMTDSGLGPYVVGGSGAGHIIELAHGGLLMPLHGIMSREWPTRGGETIRCFTLRSDDGGHNWEYWSTVAYDAASIIDWAEPGMTRLRNGRLVCLLRAHARPGRFDNLWLVYSDDDGASWSRPARTPVWGYPPDVMQLADGRVLAVYGYRRAPWGVRGCVSEDGVTWDIRNEFTIREGGAASADFPQYWHIGYPTVTQCADGTIVAAYHEYTGEPPIQCMWVTRFLL
jgi:sialidase-1